MIGLRSSSLPTHSSINQWTEPSTSSDTNPEDPPSTKNIFTLEIYSNSMGSYSQIWKHTLEIWGSINLPPLLNLFGLDF